MNVEFHEEKNLLRVSEANRVLLEVSDFPLEELKLQLRIWLEKVAEGNDQCFVFTSSDPNLTGVFRIEPRQNGWQFTSFREKERSVSILPLADWKKIIREVI